MSGRRGGAVVVPVSAATVDLLRDPCRGCVRWLRDPLEARADPRRHDLERQREWARQVTLTWGPPGVLLRDGSRTPAHAVVAPPALVPRAGVPASGPVSEDAVLLLSLSSERGAWSTQVLRALQRDLVRRHVRAVEAYGGPAMVPGCLAPGAVAAPAAPWPAPDVCRVPTRLLTDLGFVVVRQHPTSPRLRLDLRSLATVGEDLGEALRHLVPRRATAPATT